LHSAPGVQHVEDEPASSVMTEVERKFADLRRELGLLPQIAGGAANSPAAYMQSGSHSAQLFRQALSAFLNPAGGIVNAGDYLTTALGSPSMNVQIAGGVPGGQIFVPRTGTQSAGLYYGYNDAAVTLPISASNPTNPRIDVPIAQAEDAAYGDAATVFQLAVVTGTPAGSPTVPTIPVSGIALSHVAVAANATSITSGNITDERVVLSSGWVALTLGPNIAAGTIAPAVRMEASGVVRLKGSATATSSIAQSAFNAGTAYLAILPAAFAPISSSVVLQLAAVQNGTYGAGLVLSIFSGVWKLSPNLGGLPIYDTAWLDGVTFTTS
jgi:hypothetical protein